MNDANKAVSDALSYTAFQRQQMAMEYAVAICEAMTVNMRLDFAGYADEGRLEELLVAESAISRMEQMTAAVRSAQRASK